MGSRVNSATIFASSAGATQYSVAVGVATQAGDIIHVATSDNGTAVGSQAVQDSVNATNFTKALDQDETNASSSWHSSFLYQTAAALLATSTIKYTPRTSSTGNSFSADITRGWTFTGTYDQNPVGAAPARGSTWTGPALAAAASAGALVITTAGDSSTATLGVATGSPYTKGSSGTTNRATMVAFVLSADGVSTYALAGTCSATNVSLGAVAYSLLPSGGSTPISGSDSATVTEAASEADLGTPDDPATVAEAASQIAISAADSATIAEAVTGAGPASGDTGAGTDAASALAVSGVGESAVGSDAPSQVALSGAVEAGTAAEAASIAASSAEAAAGTDAPSLIAITAADTATVTEGASVNTGSTTQVSGSESATVTEAAQVAVVGAPAASPHGDGFRHRIVRIRRPKPSPTPDSTRIPRVRADLLALFLAGELDPDEYLVLAA